MRRVSGVSGAAQRIRPVSAGGQRVVAGGVPAPCRQNIIAYNNIYSNGLHMQQDRFVI